MDPPRLQNWSPSQVIRENFMGQCQDQGLQWLQQAPVSWGKQQGWLRPEKSWKGNKNLSSLSKSWNQHMKGGQTCLLFTGVEARREWALGENQGRTPPPGGVAERGGVGNIWLAGRSLPPNSSGQRALSIKGDLKLAYGSACNRQGWMRTLLLAVCPMEELPRKYLGTC